VFKKKILVFTSLIFIICSGYAANSPIKQFMLDSSIVYTINVDNSGAVTTAMFPSAIQGIYGTNVVADDKGNGSYMLSYTPGNYYFSIKLIKRENGGHSGSLNIVFNRKVYVVNLKPVLKDNAYASVTFVPDRVSSSSISSSGTAKTVAPEILLDAVDKSKMYPLYAQQYPDVAAKIKYKSTNKLFRYKNYSVKLQAIYRFNSIDTLVFWVVLKNYTDKSITYDPQNISVRAGEQIYFTSFTDASGTIPPYGTSQAYFCITGRDTGSRNYLSVDNNYVVLINAETGGINQLDKKDKIAVLKQELIQKARRLSDRLSATEDPVKVEKIYKEYLRIQQQFINL
jgi:hypothetical protein